MRVFKLNGQTKFHNYFSESSPCFGFLVLFTLIFPGRNVYTGLPLISLPLTPSGNTLTDDGKSISLISAVPSHRPSDISRVVETGMSVS